MIKIVHQELKLLIILLISLYILAGCKGTNSSTALINADTDNNLTVKDQNISNNEKLNSMPVAIPQSISLNEDASIIVLLDGTDSDNDELSYRVIVSPSHGSYVGTTYTPYKNYVGSDSFIFVVNDGKVDSEQATIDIDVISSNKAPTVDAGPDQNTLLGSEIILTAAANDSDGEIVRYEWKEEGVILSTDKIFVTSSLKYGKHNITLTVTDDNGAKASDLVEIKIKKHAIEKIINAWDADIYNTYDENGNKIIVSEDYYGIISHVYYTYDENGNITHAKYLSKQHTYTYDVSGNMLSDAYDGDMDDIYDMKFSYIYDINGNLIQELYDSNMDGKYIGEKVVTYTYDANGNMLTNSFSWGLDRAIENITSYIYDEHNNLVQETYESFKSAHTYTPTKHSTFHTYDAKDNRLSMIKKTEGSDMEFDQKSIYTYDSHGNMLSQIIYLAGQENPFKKTIYSYDEEGKMQSKGYDFAGDGTIDQSYTYDYDEFGNLLNEVRDDGFVIFEQTWIYI